MYRFLTHDVGAYLSSYETMTVYHMADLASSKRSRIKQANVKVITVPHFEGLSIDALLGYAAVHPEVMQCLPMILREREKLPRAYVANVIYTLVGEPFKEWVEKRVNDRHAKRRNEVDSILMDKEIADQFHASKAVSGKYLSSFHPPFQTAQALRWRSYHLIYGVEAMTCSAVD